MVSADRHAASGPSEGDPRWYQDAIIYELHVRAFYDSDGDGVGDFRGLTQKLDYLHDLGVTALWLLPFYPSPLKDDGYDIADYRGVHPAYGSLHDFKEFLHAAHQRGLRVITELVVNHTSNQHPWFQRARRGPPGSRWRDFYVWRTTPDHYQDARIIFKDFEASNWAWDPLAQGYYWHRFYAHQPDLNYDNPLVGRAIMRAMDFWLGLGVDGLRLDAIPYLYEREGTNCENLPETHAFLKALRHHIDERFPHRMLLAEANQWPEDALAYFGEGDESHMAFHFPLMPRLFMALRMEDRFPILDILQQTPPLPEGCQWALFLRNHDELTLEMVTDEERDYMYRVYAQDPQARVNLGIRRRLAPLLGNNRRRMELMYALLCSLPGTPVLYYGDEIGMGDNVYLGDRNAVRTPMQWNADRNAGFSRAPSPKLFLPVISDSEYHYEAINVETQQQNPLSQLWWMKRLLALRKRYQAFGRGSLELLTPTNYKVLAFLRRYQDECMLVVANLSRYVQGVELNLSSHKGLVPMELFGGTELPRIEESRYFLTLGPHDFYWLALTPPRAAEVSLTMPEASLPTLRVTGAWEEVVQGQAKPALEALLPRYLRARRWFGGRARRMKGASLLEVLPLPWTPIPACVTVVQVDYAEGDPELYVLPLTAAFGAEAARMLEDSPHPLLARLQGSGSRAGNGASGVLFDALYDPRVSAALLDAIARHRRLKGAHGEVVAWPTPAFRRLQRGADGALEPRVLQVEQSNTSVVYGERFILKLLRRLDAGVNPDLEIGRFLSEQASFPHVPPIAGAIEYRRTDGEVMTLAILQGFVPNQGDAWQYTLDALRHYGEAALARYPEVQDAPLPDPQLPELRDDDLPALARELLGAYLASARLLGERTAELHLALAQAPGGSAVAPEPFSTLYQRALYQSMRSLTGQVLPRLREHLPDLPEAVEQDAQQVLRREGELLRRFRAVVQHKITALRIRIHGDYHLGQLLYTGNDFVIIDFEGEPARPLSERRLKRSPLRDVAGMLRSFHYAAYTALGRELHGGVAPPAEWEVLEPCARFWYGWVSAVFLQAYLDRAGTAPFLPRTREELATLLDAYLLEKTVYELGYELNHRPEWVQLPLRGILELLDTAR
ncbi:MAG: maltose alpha-D-glucosyltransferase [Nitrospinae bacterium]|nr:maltose alpha-D-glucosyltransferase [Nitrospinota bacterium]